MTTTEDIDKRTAQYIEVRDALKRLEEKHAKETKPLLEIQEILAGRIRKFMDDNNITDSLKTKNGTCILSTRYSASVVDGSAFMDFVKAGHWDLIERRANPTAVRDYVKEHNTLPTGVSMSAVQTLGVRRPGKAKD